MCEGMRLRIVRSLLMAPGALAAFCGAGDALAQAVILKEPFGITVKPTTLLRMEGIVLSQLEVLARKLVQWNGEVEQ
jgi:hypothetical protein